MYENCAVEAVAVRLLTCPLFLSSLLPILLVKLFDDPELQPLAGALASSAHGGCFCKAGDCLLRAVARPRETAEMMRRAKDLRETLSAAKKRMGRAVPKKKTAGGSGKASRHKSWPWDPLSSRAARVAESGEARRIYTMLKKQETA